MDRMDIFDIKYGTPNTDILRIVVEKGQKVLITRMVTFEYEVSISDILDDMDETDISVENLIEGETDNNSISVDMDYSEKTDIVDDMVISVQIV